MNICHSLLNTDKFELASDGALKLSGVEKRSETLFESIMPYIAPELMGKKDGFKSYAIELLTPKIDVFCFGVVIYYLCTFNRIEG